MSGITKKALRRLRAIEEFTEIGSGFNVSMRDLEIRGAGNLLGTEQTGFINDVGFDLYVKLINEAVDELKYQDFKEVFKSLPKISSSKLGKKRLFLNIGIIALSSIVLVQHIVFNHDFSNKIPIAKKRQNVLHSGF